MLSSGLSLENIPPAGNFVVKLTPKALSVAIQPSGTIPAQLRLDEKQAATLRRILTLSAGNKVPMSFKVGIAFISEIVFNGTISSLVAGWLFDQAFNAIDTASVDLASISPFIAVGGLLKSHQRVAHRGHASFLLSTIEYEVSVGQESRSFTLYGCVYPVKLVVAQFTTAGPYNNKILRPIDQSRWGVWDITDSKWDDQNLVFRYQDSDYFYFLQDEFVDGKTVSKSLVRVSVLGGPYQKKRSNAQTFSTYYASVTAE